MKTTDNRTLSLLVALGLLTVCGVGCKKSNAGIDPKPDEKLVAAMRKNEAAGAAGGAAAGGATGWGTLKGRFTYNGAPPPILPMNVAVTPDCGVKQIPIEAIRVDPSSKGLRDVVIYARKVSRVTPDYESGPKKDVYFDQKECRYLSHVAASTLKDRFVILNGDSATHNSKGSPGNGNPDYNGLIPAKTTAESPAGQLVPAFKKATPFPYDVTCAIHPWMKAYHIVRNDPYVAVTAENGEFTIENLPAGEEIEFQVWHEKGAGEKGGLKAKAEWSSAGRFKMKIPENETATLDVVVEPSALLQ
jgi:hypothetical protein